jgi:ribosomal protein L24
MTRFSVGDEVIIRFGKHQGQEASIIERQPADVYKVKVEDGYILFYSEEGLEKEKAGVQEGV